MVTFWLACYENSVLTFKVKHTRSLTISFKRQTVTIKMPIWDQKAIHDKIIGTSVFYMGTTHPPPNHKKLSNDECPFTDMSVYLCSRCRRGGVTCLLSTWSRCMCLCCSWCNATVGESISVRWSHTPNTSTERASTRARRQLSPCGLIFKTRPHTQLCIGDSLVFLDLLSLEYEFITIQENHRSCTHASHNMAARAFDPETSSNAQSRLCPSLTTASIISSADIYTPTHHLAVNVSTCYLILFIFYLFFYSLHIPEVENRWSGQACYPTDNIRVSRMHVVAPARYPLPRRTLHRPHICPHISPQLGMNS